ncbi:uncharacterized protein LOC127748410 [Arachis duranensis]|uniref:Uncharacterized protein LOC127748410 n=1 Tax=Arachis duranensis TaxID=130453 RepID=A0A9C6TRJ3_ARADU|nr:uncharacterized protein LOC127748410 [Arachis duranensis]
MGRMQVSAINTQNSPQEASYDMTGNFVQNDNYDYAQASSEQAQQQQPPDQANSKSKEDSNWEMIMSFVQETRASIRNLKMQMGQISKQLLERSASTFPVRSGKVTGSETKANEELVEKESPEEKKEDVEHTPTKRADNPFPDSLYTYPTLPKAPEYKPKMPYPQRLQKASKEKQFSKFVDVFKKLQINIPFAEALEQMPLYAKFMKELLTNKRKWKEQETVVLTKECSAIIQHNLLEKMPDWCTKL